VDLRRAADVLGADKVRLAREAEFGKSRPFDAITGSQ
jgi:hypothetical protein